MRRDDLLDLVLGVLAGVGAAAVVILAALIIWRPWERLP